MLTKSQIEQAKQSKVICLTKYIMQKKHINRVKAYEYLLKTQTFKLLLDSDTRFYIEPIEALYECIDLEVAKDKVGFNELVNSLINYI